MNTDLVALIKQKEGLSLVPYKDTAGLDTIGYGHKIRPNEIFARPLTNDEALQLLTNDIAPIDAAIKKYVTVPLTTNQYNALVLLILNIGIGGFINPSGKQPPVQSKLLQSINNNAPISTIQANWLAWRNSIDSKTGKLVPNLLSRRQFEFNIYTHG